MDIDAPISPSSARVMEACLKSILAGRPASCGEAVVERYGHMVEVLRDDTQELAVFCGFDAGTYLLIVEGEGVPFDDTDFDLYLETIKQILNS
jgi:hypothetical protein